MSPRAWGTAFGASHARAPRGSAAWRAGACGREGGPRSPSAVHWHPLRDPTPVPATRRGRAAHPRALARPPGIEPGAREARAGLPPTFCGPVVAPPPPPLRCGGPGRNAIAGPPAKPSRGRGADGVPSSSEGEHGCAAAERHSRGPLRGNRPTAIEGWWRPNGRHPTVPGPFLAAGGGWAPVAAPAVGDALAAPATGPLDRCPGPCAAGRAGPPGAPRDDTCPCPNASLATGDRSRCA